MEKILEINFDTGKSNLREMTDEEKLDLDQRQQFFVNEQAEAAAAKAAAEAKLAALGLDAEDLKALGL